MVYLGPVEPRSLRVKNPNSPSEVRAVVQSNSSHAVASQEEVPPAHPQEGFVERRKQDRRKNAKSALIETRAGKDRRKGAGSSISVSV